MNQLENLYEKVWNELVEFVGHCPYCDSDVTFIISINKASVRVDCNNPNCNKVFFYRRVNLGSQE